LPSNHFLFCHLTRKRKRRQGGRKGKKKSRVAGPSVLPITRFTSKKGEGAGEERGERRGGEGETPFFLFLPSAIKRKEEKGKKKKRWGCRFETLFDRMPRSSRKETGKGKGEKRGERGRPTFQRGGKGGGGGEEGKKEGRGKAFGSGHTFS